jgi:hypothetical protein
MLSIIEDGRRQRLAADIDGKFVVLMIASIIMRTVFWFSPGGCPRLKSPIWYVI